MASGQILLLKKRNVCPGLLSRYLSRDATGETRAMEGLSNQGFATKTRLTKSVSPRPLACRSSLQVGWGTRIRTWTARVRAESSTVKLSPNRDGCVPTRASFNHWLETVNITSTELTVRPRQKRSLKSPRLACPAPLLYDYAKFGISLPERRGAGARLGRNLKWILQPHVLRRERVVPGGMIVLAWVAMRIPLRRSTLAPTIADCWSPNR